MPEKRHFQMVMTAEEFAQFNQLAQRRGYPALATYVKRLIERDGAEAGIPIRFSGERGGWRGGRKKEDTQE
jgi:hypothetical protein